MSIDKDNLLFNSADVIIKDKIFIFLSIIIFVLIGYYNLLNIDKRDKSFSISTNIYINHVQERQLDYLESALKLMSETNLDIGRKERTQHNFDVYSYTISVVPPEFNMLENIPQEITLAEPEDHPDIDIFPSIEQGKVFSNRIEFVFNFAGGKDEDAINAVNLIIQKAEDKLNNEFIEVIDTYISSYLIRYDFFQSAPIDTQIKLNDQLKNKVIMQLLDVIDYGKNSYKILNLEVGKMDFHSETPIETSRYLLAFAFFGLVFAIIISLVKNSYREYRKNFN